MWHSWWSDIPPIIGDISSLDIPPIIGYSSHHGINPILEPLVIFLALHIQCIANNYIERANHEIKRSGFEGFRDREHCGLAAQSLMT